MCTFRPFCTRTATFVNIRAKKTKKRLFKRFFVDQLCRFRDERLIESGIFWRIFTHPKHAAYVFLFLLYNPIFQDSRLPRFSWIFFATSGLFIVYIWIHLTPFATRSIICSVAYIIPACFIDSGSCPHLSRITLNRGVRDAPDNWQIRWICLAAVTGITPAMTGTWIFLR